MEPKSLRVVALCLRPYLADPDAWSWLVLVWDGVGHPSFALP